jgi:hypothetical protein
LSSSELKKVLHELCRAVEPYYIAYQLAQARRGRDSTSAGENPQLASKNHPDSPSSVVSFSSCGVGSLEAPETKETKKP